MQLRLLQTPVSGPVSVFPLTARSGPRRPGAGGMTRVSSRFHGSIRGIPDYLGQQLLRGPGGPQSGRLIVQGSRPWHPAGPDSGGAGTENAHDLPERGGGSVLKTGDIPGLCSYRQDSLPELQQRLNPNGQEETVMCSTRINWAGPIGGGP